MSDPKNPILRKLRQDRLDQERKQFLALVVKHGWNYSAAAREAKMEKRNFCRSLKRHGIERPPAPELCTCEDCQQTDKPCAGDCDAPELCAGCKEAKAERADQEALIDLAVGRR